MNQISESENLLKIHKMKFIYNAIQDGWEVKKIDNDKIEFKKSKDNIIKQYYLDTNLNKFIKDNFRNY